MNANIKIFWKESQDNMSEFQTQNLKREKIVFDYIGKFCQERNLFKALFLNVSILNDTVRSAQNRKLIQDIFLSSIKSGMAKLFELPNDDVVVIFNKSIEDEISSSVVRVQFLLQDDDRIKNASNLQDCGVASFFDLATEYADFSKKVVFACHKNTEQQTANNDVGRVSFFNTSNKRYKKGLTTEMLSKVQKIISVADFSSFIRRQAICAVIGKSAPQRVFEEVFVSIPDMRDSLLPDVEITANPWLFLALTETLDKRVLEIISRHDDGSLVGNFSVNINVSTILSDDFLRFDDSINGSMRQSIILELQLVDIFSDIRSFILAKTFAKARGYKICIDGITVDKLKYLNRKGLDCDLMKIVWHPSLPEIFNEDKHFMDYMNKAERAKIILCRIDDANAIEVGNTLGINLYQGRYVQRLLNASNVKR